MKAGKVLSLFHQYFNLSKSTNGWWRFTNPWDPKAIKKKDKTMAFNPAIKWVKDFRTGYSKPAPQFLMDYLNISYTELRNSVEKLPEISVEIFKRPKRSKVRLPEGFNSIAFGKGILGDRARKYLTGRGFNIDVLDMMGFGYCSTGQFFGYIIIPYVMNGEIVYWTARDFLGQEPKYKNPKLIDFGVTAADVFFNGDALRIFDRVHVVEGAFDALTIGSSAIATSGWSISSRQRNMILRSPVRELVFICDSGFYNTILEQVTPLITHKQISILEPDLKGGDVNEWGWENVKPLTKNLKTLTYGDIFKRTA
jgi:hypothetical protein